MKQQKNLLQHMGTMLQWYCVNSNNIKISYRLRVFQYLMEHLYGRYVTSLWVLVIFLSILIFLYFLWYNLCIMKKGWLGLRRHWIILTTLIVCLDNNMILFINLTNVCVYLFVYTTSFCQYPNTLHWSAVIKYITFNKRHADIIVGVYWRDVHFRMKKW